MKKRVLNASANKKAMRVCCAMYSLRQPYHVLCDVSFLREAYKYEKNGNEKKSQLLKSSSGNGSKGADASTTIRDMVCGALQQNNIGSVRLCILEETRNLFLKGIDGAVDHNSERKDGSATRAKRAVTAGMTGYLSFIRGFNIVGNDGERNRSGQRNEHKAIIEFLMEGHNSSSCTSIGQEHNKHLNNSQYMKKNRPIDDPISKLNKSNLIHYFVATLNHDLRRVLVARTSSSSCGSSLSLRALPPLIRLSFNPTLVWLEPPTSSPDTRNAKLSNNNMRNSSHQQDHNEESSDIRMKYLNRTLPPEAVALKSVTSIADKLFLKKMLMGSSSSGGTISSGTSLNKSRGLDGVGDNIDTSLTFNNDNIRREPVTHSGSDDIRSTIYYNNDSNNSNNNFGKRLKENLRKKGVRMPALSPSGSTSQRSKRVKGANPLSCKPKRVREVINFNDTSKESTNMSKRKARRIESLPINNK
eukprot:Tbor_TRINITY_DN2619_c0_g1::TRINITY_DN2619_c0_g1_i1::g.18032::m.18032